MRNVENRADTLHTRKEILKEIKDAWMQLIIFAASKARPETLAAQLARGGELLSFVWLQLGFCTSFMNSPFTRFRELPWGAMAY